jgi:acyl-CoA thioesterase-1
MSRKRVVIALCVLLAGVLGAAGTVAHLTFVRSPANPPAQACAGSEPSGTVVVAAGASMTAGTLGADWVGALRERAEFRGHTFVNAGVNGNTSADLLGRIDTDVVACRPDAVTLLIGTNDVRDGVPLEQYRENLAAIVDRIRSRTQARIALMSLPPFGENLDAGINRRLAAYNGVIKDTAARARVDYLPLYERLAGLLRQGERPSYDFGFGLAFRAGAEHYLLGRNWDEVARGNGLDLFVDHIHLSDRGGAVLTDLAAGWLSS